MSNVKLAVIGGSGLYGMNDLEKVKEIDVPTPFGNPSDAVTIVNFQDTEVAFLPRHGRNHTIPPTNIPSKANIYALKTLGVESIVSISAVGSLQEYLRPMDLVVPDQLIDRTRNRKNTFFDCGVVAHIGFSDPFCPVLSSKIYECAEAVSGRVHLGGTYVVIEGPAFSSRAESNMYRSWKADIIGMTALPEAKLAREAEICYSTLACVTDYDCWHDAEEVVTVEMIIDNLQKNIANSQDILRKIIPIVMDGDCNCRNALKDSILTQLDRIPLDLKEKMRPIIGKYL